VKHRFIEDHRHRYGVKVLCDALQVSRSGYYAARCGRRVRAGSGKLR
jgi:hypothetical protein